MSDEAERISRQCGVTFRLFNYPAVEEASSQHRIATNVMVRARYRYKAGKFLRLYIDAYLKHSPKPDAATCQELTRKVTLVSTDPDVITEREAAIMGEEMHKIMNNILEEDVTEDTLVAEEKAEPSCLVHYYKSIHTSRFKIRLNSSVGFFSFLFSFLFLFFSFVHHHQQ